MMKKLLHSFCSSFFCAPARESGMYATGRHIGQPLQR